MNLLLSFVVAVTAVAIGLTGCHLYPRGYRRTANALFALSVIGIALSIVLSGYRAKDRDEAKTAHEASAAASLVRNIATQAGLPVSAFPSGIDLHTQAFAPVRIGNAVYACTLDPTGTDPKSLELWCKVSDVYHPVLGGHVVMQ